MYEIFCLLPICILTLQKSATMTKQISFKKPKRVPKKLLHCNPPKPTHKYCN